MEDKKRLIKNISITFGILIVLLLVLFFVGKAFGLFSYTKEGQTRSIVTLGGINVTILNDSENNLDLINGYPMPDNEGLLRNPIEFNIENVGTQKALDITLKLVNDTESQDNCVIEGTNTPCTELSANKIRYAYKIGNGSYSTPANLGENNNIIFNDLIDPQEVIKVSLVIWIDKEAGNEIQGSYFYGNLVITGEKYTLPVDTTFTFDNIDPTGNPNVISYTVEEGVTAYTFNPPVSGNYRLEVWGAQGGLYENRVIGGYGAYAVGEMYLTSAVPLYVVIGGQGAPNSGSTGGAGGYNGGASGGKGSSRYSGGSGGGGATHIATRPGLLKDLENSKDSVIIVAAGGGGSTNTWTGGGKSGGGFQGMSDDVEMFPTQTTGYAFGQGQVGRNSVQVNSGDAQGGGGAAGGWYGGYTKQTTGVDSCRSGGSGSSYLKSTLINKGMYCYNCEEAINLPDDADIFTVKTNGTSEYINQDECPNGYNSEPIAKCAKQGTGKARITYLGD